MSPSLSPEPLDSGEPSSKEEASTASELSQSEALERLREAGLRGDLDSARGLLPRLKKMDQAFINAAARGDGGALQWMEPAVPSQAARLCAAMMAAEAGHAEAAMAALEGLDLGDACEDAGSLVARPERRGANAGYLRLLEWIIPKLDERGLAVALESAARLGSLGGALRLLEEPACQRMPALAPALMAAIHNDRVEVFKALAPRASPAFKRRCEDFAAYKGRPEIWKEALLSQMDDPPKISFFGAKAQALARLLRSASDYSQFGNKESDEAIARLLRAGANPKLRRWALFGPSALSIAKSVQNGRNGSGLALLSAAAEREQIERAVGGEAPKGDGPERGEGEPKARPKPRL